MRVVGLCRRVPQTLVWEPSAWWRLVPTACLKGSMPWMMMNIACAACFILCQKHQQHLPESSLGVKSGSHKNVTVLLCVAVRKWQVISHPDTINPFPASLVNYVCTLKLLPVTVGNNTLIDWQGACYVLQVCAKGALLCHICLLSRASNCGCQSDELRWGYRSTVHRDAEHNDNEGNPGALVSHGFPEPTGDSLAASSHLSSKTFACSE